MKEIARFFVHAKPEPAGSKVGFGYLRVDGDRCPSCDRNMGKIGVSVVDANKKVDAWKKQVKAVARKVWGGKDLVTGAVVVEMVFHAIRPKSHYRSGRSTSHLLTKAAPDYPTMAPDALKFARGVEDALTKVIYYDDAQIVSGRQHKIYSDRVGVEVIIWQFDPLPREG